jgi:RHS repeat-associated protein
VAQTTGNLGNLTYQAAYTAFGHHNCAPTLNGNNSPLSPAAWGAQEWTATGALTDTFRANTKEEDAFGFTDQGERTMSQDMDCFISKDPLGPLGPDGPNLYTYVRQNPWTYFDPQGLTRDLPDLGGFDGPGGWLDMSAGGAPEGEYTEGPSEMGGGTGGGGMGGGGGSAEPAPNAAPTKAPAVSDAPQQGNAPAPTSTSPTTSPPGQPTPASGSAPVASDAGASSPKPVPAAPPSSPASDTPGPAKGGGGPKPSPNFKTPTNPPQPPPASVPPGYTLRVDPNPSTAYPEAYPYGYWRIEKPMTQGGAQGIDPSTMKPGPQEATHVPLPAPAPAPMPQASSPAIIPGAVGAAGASSNNQN